MGLLDRWKNKKKEQQLVDNAVKVEQKTAAAEAKAVEASSVKAVAAKTVVEGKKAEKAAKKPAAAKAMAGKDEKQRAVKAGEIAYKILVRPLVTEKSAIAESMNKYSFVVQKDANKNQIMQAVLELYGVKPVSVNMINVDGRRVRFGRSIGRRSDYKKAIVTLPQGKAITIHEGV